MREKAKEQTFNGQRVVERYDRPRPEGTQYISDDDNDDDYGDEDNDVSKIKVCITFMHATRSYFYLLCFYFISI